MNWEMEDEGKGIVLRPEVLAFAQLMELRLRAKDEILGVSWKVMSRDELLDEACDKCSIAQKEPLNRRHPIDVANYCMMIADVTGALESGVIENGGAGWAGLDQVQMS